jgi:hypothetical protein
VSWAFRALTPRREPGPYSYELELDEALAILLARPSGLHQPIAVFRNWLLDRYRQLDSFPLLGFHRNEPFLCPCPAVHSPRGRLIQDPR